VLGMAEPSIVARAPSRLVTDRPPAKEALELAVQVGVNRAVERFGVQSIARPCTTRGGSGVGAADRPAGGCPAGL
jgi:hypothetical protein